MSYYVIFGCRHRHAWLQLVRCRLLPAAYCLPSAVCCFTALRLSPAVRWSRAAFSLTLPQIALVIGAEAAAVAGAAVADTLAVSAARSLARARSCTCRLWLGRRRRSWYGSNAPCVGKTVLKTPNMKLDCSFCCRVAWPRLAEKQCFFTTL